MSAARVRRPSSKAVTGRFGRCITAVPHRVIGRTVPPSGSGPYGAWTSGEGVRGAMASSLGPRGRTRDRPHAPEWVTAGVTPSYIATMSLTKSLRPGGKHGLSSKESRDPIGYAVAALNVLAPSPLPDRFGLRRTTEQAVFTTTRGGFKALGAASRTFARKGAKGGAGVRPAAARADRVFDLTPTEDEQMLVDVVTELATEVVRPAAAKADEACATPSDVLASATEIGIPLLGVPEALGGISEERSAVAGVLVTEALARGDLGIAVAAMAPGAVATALSLW